MLVSSSPAQSLPLGNPHLRNNVDNTLAVLVAAAAPPLHSIMPSAIITQVLILNRGYHALSSCCFCRLLPQHPALLHGLLPHSAKKQVTLPCDGPARGIMKTGQTLQIYGVRLSPGQSHRRDRGWASAEELEHGPCPSKCFNFTRHGP